MRTEGKIKDGNLPPEYTMIFDSMRAMYPDVKPVIEHFQASRKLRMPLGIAAASYQPRSYYGNLNQELGLLHTPLLGRRVTGLISLRE